ncbi:hypothetical protein [Chitinophaga pinensis]|uniref:Uncharacterized protein n=1 Tax=Chitinophaga pinensis (strain ATCC 43595 / DSM 2588 / LMG 13176 / NBRC 15968 / NCIMB 11800 / UQM 2034) TaxID=485918 RepID=A0A979GTA7_CHIPD|nr:hypothetical protein [Chitinophaga pinensis]ACU60019.1 hypothetical protein Cpin_2535 [Chitinophaga pinensis DSM 2588]
MIAISNGFSYILPDSKGKPYTIKVNFTSMPQSYEISPGEPIDIISVTVLKIDEESGFQEIFNYYIRDMNGELSIGTMKKQQFNPIKSQMLEELKEQVLVRYEDIAKEK